MKKFIFILLTLILLSFFSFAVKDADVAFSDVVLNLSNCDSNTTSTKATNSDKGSQQNNNIGNNSKKGSPRVKFFCKDTAIHVRDSLSINGLLDSMSDFRNITWECMPPNILIDSSIVVQNLDFRVIATADGSSDTLTLHILQDTVEITKSDVGGGTSQHNSFSRFLPAILFVVVFILFVLLIYFLKKNRKEILQLTKQIDEYRKNIKESENEISKLKYEKVSFNSKIDRLEKDKQERERQALIRENKAKEVAAIKESEQVNQPCSLYADTIIDGKFHRVKEHPDEDTIFELKLANASALRAIVTVCKQSYKRVIANPYFLQGCKKQILGNSSVVVTREGIANKDSDGKWMVIAAPEIEIQ